MPRHEQLHGNAKGQAKFKVVNMDVTSATTATLFSNGGTGW